MWGKTESWDSSSWRFLRILSKHAKKPEGKVQRRWSESLFLGVPSDNGHKLKHRKLSLNIKKHFSTLRITEHWHRLPRARWLNQIPAILWRTAKKEQHPSLRLYILPSLCCYSQWLGYTQLKCIYNCSHTFDHWAHTPSSWCFMQKTDDSLLITLLCLANCSWILLFSLLRTAPLSNC